MVQELKVREKQIKKVLLITLGLNFFVALIKIVAGYQFHYLSLSSSGLESVFDGSSNIFSLIAITLAAKPRDEKHNYGHHKFETLGSLIISILLFISALQLSFEYKELIFDKNLKTGSFGLIPVATIILSIGVSLFVSTYEKREGKRLNSPILLADSEHTFGDMLLSFGVLISILCSKFHWFLPDIIIGICIILYLIYLAIKIARKNLNDLLDASPEIEASVINKIMELPKVVNVHRFRARGNANWMQIDFHLLLEPELSLIEAHKISHQAEDLLKNLLIEYCRDIDVIVHFEPYDKSHTD